ncbi:hypothetical protein [Devosia sp. RR2S18]|uniref:hypothetical protein n=1 Tax=Devosia rhizosphaerae TaxID=3049774 RepID=UPI002541117C|nr:hypothetical protein [Devosia sp. RR2S18]WIJ26702.1 hypothetical protein QOV41_08110 [Devosia sp. RR2S18]
MNFRPVIGGLVALTLALLPAASLAQGINVTRSILEDQPFTMIYPETMVASGGAGEPLIINHPDAPLQCELTIVPVDDAAWSAETALASLKEEDIAAGWAESLPGFTLANSATVPYQSATALLYEGTSSDSPMGVPLTVFHTETVDNGRGYSLDCLFATEVAEQARPVVDFIIANFSTRADADCCVGLEETTEESAPAQ